MNGYLTLHYNKDHVLYVDSKGESPSGDLMIYKYAKGIEWSSRRCLCIIFSLIALAILVIVISAISVASGCGAEYISTEYHVHLEKKNWLDAQLACEEEGRTLVTIHTEE